MFRFALIAACMLAAMIPAAAQTAPAPKITAGDRRGRISSGRINPPRLSDRVRLAPMAPTALTAGVPISSDTNSAQNHATQRRAHHARNNRSNRTKVDKANVDGMNVTLSTELGTGIRGCGNDYRYDCRRLRRCSIGAIGGIG